MISIVFNAFADNYSFNLDELESIETKSYEYGGYIKGEYKYQMINESSPLYPSKNKDVQDTKLTEAFLNFKYFQDSLSFHTDLMANHENIDHIQEETYTLNQAFVNYKYDANHQLYLGKKTLKWGKGYFFNPVAFIDRKKDPNDPEASREGYFLANYQYNKVYEGDLQNFAFDIVFLQTASNFNDNLYENHSNILALKSYFLYRDIDIDLVYIYSDKQTEKVGLDFSTNLQTNFEIHGEFGKFSSGYYSYLLGFKYLNEKELTILFEYYYQSQIQAKNSPFWDKSYLITSLTQKEPFDMLYLNAYYKNTLNLQENSHQNKIGILYIGVKNFDFDFSISKNFGKSTSEFGSKLIQEFAWLSIKYSF